MTIEPRERPGDRDAAEVLRDTLTRGGVGGEVAAAGAHSWLARASIAVGSVALLGVMLVDFAAVIGRHTGVPLLGSLELSELFIVCMASASLVITTFERGHASVHILTERLGARTRGVLRRATDALCAAFFVAILVGSVMVIGDLWNGDERSELLQIPILPLRVLFCACAVALVVAFIAQAASQRSRT
jgi:TRAP-type C4-dicarboxylate transport system permease small subunit